jgi:hypothetical protein
MTRPRHCLTILVVLFANLLMVACTDSQELPFTEHEIQELRNRTVPEDGRLVATSKAVKDQFGIRATWDIETRSDNRVYFQWLKSQLNPEYHVTTETGLTIMFTKETAGDSYRLEVSGNALSGHSVARETFLAVAD